MQTVQTRYQEKKIIYRRSTSPKLRQTTIQLHNAMADIQKTPFVRDLASSGTYNQCDNSQGLTTKLLSRPQSPRQGRRVAHTVPALTQRPDPRRTPQALERPFLLLLPLRPTADTTSARPCTLLLPRPVSPPSHRPPLPARILDHYRPGLPLSGPPASRQVSAPDPLLCRGCI